MSFPPPQSSAYSAPPPSLPPGWTAHVDPASGQQYYHHLQSGSTQWQPPAPPPSAPALIPPLDYYDAFLGRPMSIAPRNCAQISAPLCLIRAAPGHLRLPRDHVPQRQQQRLHLSCAGVSFWPMQLQRAAIGCAAALSRRLTTAPASCLFSAVTMQRWAARVQVRVMGCLIGRLQVRLSRALQFARLRKR